MSNKEKKNNKIKNYFILSVTKSQYSPDTTVIISRVSLPKKV